MVPRPWLKRLILCRPGRTPASNATSATRVPRPSHWANLRQSTTEEIPKRVFTNQGWQLGISESYECGGVLPKQKLFLRLLDSGLLAPPIQVAEQPRTAERESERRHQPPTWGNGWNGHTFRRELLGQTGAATWADPFPVALDELDLPAAAAGYFKIQTVGTKTRFVVQHFDVLGS